jgi:hypothetical protein
MSEQGKKLTLAELARARGLAVETLIHLGWTERSAGIAIPWVVQGGGVAWHVRHRLERTGAGPRWTWQGFVRDCLLPYGIDHLSQMQERAPDVLVVTESEADAVCLWSADVAALATGGADGWQGRWWSLALGFGRVVLWLEDSGSLTLLQRMAETRPTDAPSLYVCHTLALRSVGKDPGRVLASLHGAGQETLRRIVAGAVPVTGVVHTPDELLLLVTERLSARRLSSGYEVRCPFHDDRSPSLSIFCGADGVWAFRCHGGSCGVRGPLTLLAGCLGIVLSSDHRLRNQSGRVGQRGVDVGYQAKDAADAAGDGAGDESGEATDSAISSAGQRLEPEPGRGRGKVSRATMLVHLAERAGIDLFHTSTSEAFAIVPVDGHLETVAIRSKAFSRWLARAFYQTHGSVPGAQALADAALALEGQALFGGSERAVQVRLAEHPERGDAIYLDLGDATWRVVEVSSQGWGILPAHAAPVCFWRPRGLLPLPEPARGGRLAELRTFVNLPPDEGEHDWHLLVGWLLAATRPRGPYPVLVVHGEQGSAKSSLVRALRELVDPHATPLRAEPRTLDDLMIAAANSWLQAYDNLSHLPPWLSDALCRLSTGGGLSKRELYSDREETLLEAQRPVAINGIEELVTRADLLDRAILLYLPRIPEDRRLPEREFWARFYTARPRILGALLEAVAAGLARLDHVRLSQLPRMADFATWVTACAPALGWSATAFLEAYNGNRAGAHELVLEASPVTGPLRVFLSEQGGTWCGTASDLLGELSRRLAEREREGRKPPGWPANGRALSNALRRLAPNLRAVGIDVVFARDGSRQNRRVVSLRLGAEAVLAATTERRQVRPNGERL